MLTIRFRVCPLCDASVDTTEEFKVADASSHPSYKPELPPTMRWLRCRSCNHVFTESYRSEEGDRVLFSSTLPHQLPNTTQSEHLRNLWAPTVHRIAQRLSETRALANVFGALGADRPRWADIGFGNGGYDKPDSYDGSSTVLKMGTSDTCTYPACDPASLSTMDAAATNVAVRAQLPAGGVLMTRDNNTGVNSKTDGNLWIMWQEPDSRTPMHAATSDNCPSDISQNYASTRPRCLYVRFKL